MVVVQRRWNKWCDPIPINVGGPIFYRNNKNNKFLDELKRQTMKVDHDVGVGVLQPGLDPPSRMYLSANQCISVVIAVAKK